MSDMCGDNVYISILQSNARADQDDIKYCWYMSRCHAVTLTHCHAGSLTKCNNPMFFTADPGWDNSRKSLLRYWVLLLANSWRRNRSSPSSLTVAWPRGTPSRGRFCQNSGQLSGSRHHLPLLHFSPLSLWLTPHQRNSTPHKTIQDNLVKGRRILGRKQPGD